MPSIEEYMAAGLYDPTRDATAGRLELLEWLDEKGFTISEMVRAEANDSLGSIAGDRRLAPGRRLTFAEASESSGVSASDLEQSAIAFGLMTIEDSPEGEVGVTTDEVATLVLFQALGSMFTEDEAESFLRVTGSSLGRVAEAAVSMFLADVESPLLTGGSGELVLARKVEEAVGLMDGFAEALDPILRRHMLQAIERTRRTSIDMHERFQYRYAVGFVDLVGFTAVSGKMGAPELSSFLRDFEGRAHKAATSEGARIVKLIGDEVMFVATEPGAACRAASALMDGFGAADERVVPRGGVALGDVLVRGGDYYGSVVNLASRLVDEAVPQEVLVTTEVAEAAADCSFEPAGRRMVKGFADPISVFSLVD